MKKFFIAFVALSLDTGSVAFAKGLNKGFAEALPEAFAKADALVRKQEVRSKVRREAG